VFAVVVLVLIIAVAGITVICDGIPSDVNGFLMATTAPFDVVLFADTTK
jgi:hypothetical protein